MRVVSAIGGSPLADLHEAYQRAASATNLRGFVLIHLDDEDVIVNRNWIGTRDLMGVYMLEIAALIHHHRNRDDAA